MTARNKTPHPDYRPDALRNLEEFLGKSDAAVEWIEVAVRHLKDSAAESSETLSELAQRVNVRVTPIDLRTVEVRSAGLQLAAVFQHFESFLRTFRQSHPRMIADPGSIRDRGRGESLLDYVLSVFSATRDLVGEWEWDTVKYYAAVRNHLMHYPTDPQDKADSNVAVRLKDRRPPEFGKLSAPNLIEELCFDDFVLFTRLAKHVARRLCTVSTPTAQQLRAVIEKNETLLRTLGSESPGAERLRKKVEMYLRTRYGLSTAAGTLAAEIVGIGPLAQG